MLGMQSDAEFRTSKLQILAESRGCGRSAVIRALVYEGYKGILPKLEMCMELVQNAVNGGHKLLLFSQFTTMLDVLAVRLKKSKKFLFYMLTGSTSRKNGRRWYMHLMRMILLFSAFL